MMSDSDPAAAHRRDTWRKLRDRRQARIARATVSVSPTPDALAALIVTLSRGRISSKAARDLVCGAGDTAICIVVDPQTGLIERWSMKVRFPSLADRDPIAPAA